MVIFISILCDIPNILKSHRTEFLQEHLSDSVHTDITSILRSDMPAQAQISKASFHLPGTKLLPKQTKLPYVRTEKNNHEALLPEGVHLYSHHMVLSVLQDFSRQYCKVNTSTTKAATITAPLFLVLGIRSNTMLNTIHIIPASPSLVINTMILSRKGVCNVWIQSKILNSMS